MATYIFNGDMFSISQFGVPAAHAQPRMQMRFCYCKQLLAMLIALWHANSKARFFALGHRLEKTRYVLRLINTKIKHTSD